MARLVFLDHYPDLCAAAICPVAPPPAPPPAINSNLPLYIAVTLGLVIGATVVYKLDHL